MNERGEPLIVAIDEDEQQSQPEELPRGQGGQSGADSSMDQSSLPGGQRGSLQSLREFEEQMLMHPLLLPLRSSLKRKHSTTEPARVEYISNLKPT